VALLVSRLPHSCVGLRPTGRGPVGEHNEQISEPLVELAQIISQEVDGVEDLAVYVELELGPRLVTDTDRAAVAVAAQVFQRVLSQITLAQLHT